MLLMSPLVVSVHAPMKAHEGKQKLVGTGQSMYFSVLILSCNHFRTSAKTTAITHILACICKFVHELIILSNVHELSRSIPGGGGGGTSLYGLYRYVRPQRVWFFSRFGHK